MSGQYRPRLISVVAVQYPLYLVSSEISIGSPIQRYPQLGLSTYAELVRWSKCQNGLEIVSLEHLQSLVLLGRGLRSGCVLEGGQVGGGGGGCGGWGRCRGRGDRGGRHHGANHRGLVAGLAAALGWRQLVLQSFTFINTFYSNLHPSLLRNGEQTQFQSGFSFNYKWID